MNRKEFGPLREIVAIKPIVLVGGMRLGMNGVYLSCGHVIYEYRSRNRHQKRKRCRQCAGEPADFRRVNAISATPEDIKHSEACHAIERKADDRWLERQCGEVWE